MSTKNFTPADSIEGVKGSRPELRRRFKSAREELPQINRDYLEERTRKLGRKPSSRRRKPGKNPES